MSTKKNIITKEKLRIKQWGEVKFVPKVPKHSNPFSGPPKFETSISSAPKNNFKNNFPGKQQRRGNSKFTPRDSNVSRPPRECSNVATPWKQYKDDLIAKQHEEEANANSIDMKSMEAQEMLKKREQNYRRNLITKQSKEPTKWESFEDNTAAIVATSGLKKENNKKEGNQFVKDIDFKNFKSTNLNFHQNNQFRKIITKGIQLANRKNTLENIVKDMKYQKQIEKRKKEESKRKIGIRKKKQNTKIEKN